MRRAEPKAPTAATPLVHMPKNNAAMATTGLLRHDMCLGLYPMGMAWYRLRDAGAEESP